MVCVSGAGQGQGMPQMPACFTLLGRATLANLSSREPQLPCCALSRGSSLHLLFTHNALFSFPHSVLLGAHPISVSTSLFGGKLTKPNVSLDPFPVLLHGGTPGPALSEEPSCCWTFRGDRWGIPQNLATEATLYLYFPYFMYYFILYPSGSSASPSISYFPSEETCSKEKAIN